MKALSAPALAEAVALAGCGGGDPFQSQLRADIRQAKRDSPYGFRQGFVSRWDNGGEPAFASCILMGFDPERRRRARSRSTPMAAAWSASALARLTPRPRNGGNIARIRSRVRHGAEGLPAGRSDPGSSRLGRLDGIPIG